jgi:MOSC domain-containing protein YiiM
MEQNIAKVVSIQVGEVITIGNKNSKDITSKEYTTASYKKPIDKLFDVTKLSIIGDSVADTIHHGGVDKAVFANSLNNYNHWKSWLKQDNIPYGALGENLTIDTIDEQTVCIGDIHQIGTVKLQVSQPRQPCWKISRRWEHKDFMQEIYTSGLTGWYYRVLEEGSFKADDSVKYLGGIDTKITIIEANKAMRDQNKYSDLVDTLLGIKELAQAWKNSLNKRDQ